MVCIDDEIPFETPNGWEWCRLNSLADIVRGGSPRPAGSPEYYNGNIPFLKVADLTKDNQMYVSSYTATIKEAGLKKTRKVSANTLLLTNSGATLGVPKVCTFETTFNDGIAAFLYLTEELKPYLYWFLCAMTDIFRNINQGTAQPNLNTDIIKETLFAVPPIAEQRRIINKIEELSPIIDKYSLAQNKLSQLNSDIYACIKKSILYEAIQGRLVPQDASEEPATILLQRFKEEKLRLVKEGKLKKKDVIDSTIFRGDDNKYYEQIGKNLIDITDDIPFDIPSNWVWTRIGYLFAHNNGKQLNKGNSAGTLMEYITTSNLYWDGFKLDYLKMMPFEESEIERCQAIKGDLLVCEGGDVGRSCIWTYDYPIMLQNHIHKLRAYLPLCTKYFFYIFYLYNLIGLIGGKGIGIQGFSAKALHNTIIPLPPLKEQERIVKKIETVLDKIKVV